MVCSFVMKIYTPRKYGHPEVPIFVGIAAIYSWAEFYCLCGMPIAIHVGIVYIHSYNEQNIAVCIGCLSSQRNAYIYCENRHPDAYIYVNIGIGVPIFT